MVKYVLKKPIVIGTSVPITELHFREDMCAGDVRDIDFDEIKKIGTQLKIAGRLCGQTDLEMNALSLKDTVEVCKLVGGFLEAGL